MKAPHPTPVELELLKALWRDGRLSAREVHDRTERVTRWSFSSTRKTLDRMIEKGLVAAADAHGLRLYRAKVQKLATIASMWRDFADRVLGAPASAPVTHFAENDFLSSEEIAELRRMLEDGQ
jgi:BlaI family transcriptional regulator, penicillinase repressor